MPPSTDWLRKPVVVNRPLTGWPVVHPWLWVLRRVGDLGARLALLHEQRLSDFANEAVRVEHVGVGESDTVDREVGSASHVDPVAGGRP